MTLSRDERQSIIDRTQSNPDEIGTETVDKVAMGVYEEGLQAEAVDALTAVSRETPDIVTEMAAKSLVDALTDAPKTVRMGAATAIGNFAAARPQAFNDDIGTVTNRITKETDRRVQRRIAEAVEKISQQSPSLLVDHVVEVVGVLDDDSRHEDELTKREAIVVTLGNVALDKERVSREELNALATALEDSWKGVRQASLEALADVATTNPERVEPTLPDVVALVTDSEEPPAVRIAAIDMIENVGVERPDLVEDVLPEVADVLPDEEASRPDQIERATAPYGDGETQVHARIIQLLQHPELSR